VVEHDFSENRYQPRIKSGAGFFGIMLQQPIVNRSARPCRAPLNRTGRTMATSTIRTAPVALPDATPQTAPIERDARTDALVAKLRALIAEARQERNHPRCERAELDAPKNEASAPTIEPRRDWLARGLKFWCL
jgi:hypothetical protein